MKKPEEYLADITLSDVQPWNLNDEVEVIILQAQKEAYNQALEDAVKSVKVKRYVKHCYSRKPRWKSVKDSEEIDLSSYAMKVAPDKASIRKLKIK